MSIPPEPQIEREKKLSRRPAIGFFATLGIGLVFGLITMGVLALLKNGFPPDSTPAPQAILLALIAMGFLLFIALGSLAFIFYLTRWSNAWQKQNYERGNLVLQQTLPELSNDQPAPKLNTQAQLKRAFQSLPILLAACLGVYAARWAVNRFWPDAPDWIPSLLPFAVLLFLLPLLSSPIPTQNAHQKRKIKPQDLLSKLLLSALIILPTVLLLIATDLRSNKTSPSILIIGIPFLAIGGYFAYAMLPFLWALSALKRGNYAVAIQRCELLEQWHVMRGMFLNLRGYALFLSGQYAIAEQVLRDSILATRKELGAGGSDGLDNIGCVLTAQGQYDEAIKLFKGAIEISPLQVAPYVDLGMAYLLQGIEPEQTLELSKRAIENFQRSLLSRLLERYNLATAHANRAWALALLGRQSEAASTLREAFAQAEPNFVPEMAGLHLRAGYVERLNGNEVKAREHWRTALQLDPNGHYGKMATRALSSN